MRKKLAMVGALMVLVALVSASIPALAQSESRSTTDAEVLPRPALGIRAPRVAPVGEEVTMMVFDRRTKEPVAGAMVWALPRGNAAELRAEIAKVKEAGNVPAAEEDYEALVSLHGGEPIGPTDENGQVTHTFEEAGLYLLVAVRGGYFPGFAPIHIKALRPALGIRAPRVAPVGEEVTIMVFDRRTKEPVEGAVVWVLPRGNAAELRAEIARLKEAGNVAAAEEDYEALVSLHGGEPIGPTDENGQVTHVFEEAGTYLLVAVKGGCLPGFSFIGVRSAPTTDAAKALRSAGGQRARRMVRVAGSQGLQKTVRSTNRVMSAQALRVGRPAAAAGFAATSGMANRD